MPRLRVGDLELAYEVDGAGEPLLLLMGLGGDRAGLGPGPAGAGAPASSGAARQPRRGRERRGARPVRPGRHGRRRARADGPPRHRALPRPRRVHGRCDRAASGARRRPRASPASSSRATWGRTDAFLAAMLGVVADAGGAPRARDVPRRGHALGLHVPGLRSARPRELLAFQEARRARGALLRSVAAYQRQVDACLAHDVLGVLPHAAHARRSCWSARTTS